jgi:hypothetical protein
MPPVTRKDKKFADTITNVTCFNRSIQTEMTVLTSMKDRSFEMQQLSRSSDSLFTSASAINYRFKKWIQRFTHIDEKIGQRR